MNTAEFDALARELLAMLDSLPAHAWGTFVALARLDHEEMVEGRSVGLARRAATASSAFKLDAAGRLVMEGAAPGSPVGRMLGALKPEPEPEPEPAPSPPSDEPERAAARGPAKPAPKLVPMTLQSAPGREPSPVSDSFRVVPKSPRDLVWRRGVPPEPRALDVILVWIDEGHADRIACLYEFVGSEAGGAIRWRHTDPTMPFIDAAEAAWWTYLGRFNNEPAAEAEERDEATERQLAVALRPRREPVLVARAKLNTASEGPELSPRVGAMVARWEKEATESGAPLWDRIRGDLSVFVLREPKPAPEFEPARWSPVTVAAARAMPGVDGLAPDAFERVLDMTEEALAPIRASLRGHAEIERRAARVGAALDRHEVKPVSDEELKALDALEAKGIERTRMRESDGTEYARVPNGPKTWGTVTVRGADAIRASIRDKMESAKASLELDEDEIEFLRTDVARIRAAREARMRGRVLSPTEAGPHVHEAVIGNLDRQVDAVLDKLADAGKEIETLCDALSKVTESTTHDEAVTTAKDALILFEGR